MEVKLIAITRFLKEGTFYESGTEALIEYAGRICYRSEAKGNPAAFVRRRVEQGHESIIEHASASFEISGISRACSHQLVRHRLCSFSMESQRYVSWKKIAEECLHPYHDSLCNEEQVAETMRQWFVQPPSLSNQIWVNGVQDSCFRYLRALEKSAKPEDARFLLPIAANTKLIMTANFRELSHIFRLRISPPAQWEIREVCVRMLEQVFPYAPNVFGGLRQELVLKYPEFFEAADKKE